MPESGVTKHNYLFCQFVNPARGHEGDRCDCFDTPSQRRTTLAKQRLARLRAKREINRASTSNDPESAVASDLAVTWHLIICFASLLYWQKGWRRRITNGDRLSGLKRTYTKGLLPASESTYRTGKTIQTPPLFKI